MTEEPYRWLEAIENRREYVRDQLRGGSPVLARSLPEGILVVGVGTGQRKVFEVFDRQVAAALGHPADIEKLRQSIIDMAHIEAFTRASEDVTLSRLVGYGLSPLIKSNFEQLFSAPTLAEWLFAELGDTQTQDVLMRLHFHGGFENLDQGVAVVDCKSEREVAATDWLRSQADSQHSGGNPSMVLDQMLQAWWILSSGKTFGEGLPVEEDRKAGWRAAVVGKNVEIAWMDRRSRQKCKVFWRTLGDFGL